MPLETSIHISGSDHLTAAFRRINVSAELAGKKLVKDGGELIAKRAREVFHPRPPKSAKKVITSSGTRKRYVGGAASDGRPTQRSGNLQRSIRVTVSSKRHGHGNTGHTIWESETGPTVVYGRRVELGMNYGLGADAYPYMRPGFKKATPELRAMVRRIYRQEIRG